MGDNEPSSDKLVDLWMHQNWVIWSRVKVALALQAVVTAGWYYSMTDDLPEVSAPLALLGAFLALMLFVTVQFDLAARAKVRAELEKRGASLPSGGGRWVPGLMIFGLLACSSTLGWCSLKYPHSMAAPSAEDSNDTATSRASDGRLG